MYITIGRNPQSDIVITGYDVVSFDHATIEYEDGKYLFIDDSSNGTTVEGVKINHESRPVKPGDTVMLAGKCALNWDLVLAKVKAKGGDTGAVVAEKSRPTMPHVRRQSNPPQPSYKPSQSSSADGTSANEVARKRFFDKEINKWNWGAFLLGWIWGVFNNVYWTLIALIPIPLCALVVSIIAGVKGTRQSWENGHWQDTRIEEFKKKQKGWMIAGFIVLGISILIPILMWSTIVDFVTSLL